MFCLKLSLLLCQGCRDPKCICFHVFLCSCSFRIVWLDVSSRNFADVNKVVWESYSVSALEGFVCHVFTVLFFDSRKEHLWNKEKCFLFYCESSFRSLDNQTLTFQYLNVTRHQMPKDETQNTRIYWITWKV